MINIDWNYAPPGAEHFHKGDILYRPHWRKSGFFCDLGFEAFGWIKDTYPSPINECIERPKPKQWSGPQDGLPPIGTICEVRQIYRDGEWKIREIIYISYHNLITADGVLEYHDDCRSVEFRPIKTPEQLAAEQRETAIADMAKVLPGAKHECWTCNPDGSVKPYENTYEILGLLVDAGFKREVK